jgi:hypothetical protein
LDGGEMSDDIVFLSEEKRLKCEKSISYLCCAAKTTK